MKSLFGAIGLIVGLAAVTLPASVAMESPSLVGEAAGREAEAVRSLARRGAVLEAVSRLQKIADSDALLTIRTDRDFGALWFHPAGIAYLNPANFAERHVAAARLAWERQPRNLHARYDFIVALRTNGRFDEAVDAAHETIAHPESYIPDPDIAKFLTNEEARALMSRGDFAEANDLLRSILDLPPRDLRDAVPRLLNYARMSLYEGHYEDAIKAIRLVERNVSGSVLGGVRYMDICSLRGLGRFDDGEKALNAFFKARDQSPLSVVHALVCYDRLDEAAKVLVSELSNERRRDGALGILQQCEENPKLPPLMIQHWHKVRALAQRPEVQRAVDAVGVIVQVPIPCYF